MTGTDFYGTRSLWLETAGDLTPRGSLPGDTDVDIAIVGAGMTGLWTAYYLARADPSLRIAVLEKDIAGFGASGRNGGWCSAFFAVPREQIAAEYGRDAAIAMQREMFETVREVGRVCDTEGLDADFHLGGAFAAATGSVQAGRAEAAVEDARAFGFGEEDFALLSLQEAKDRVRVAGMLCATFTPHCAVLQPGRLTRELARACAGLGAKIYERTAVTAIAPGRVATDRGNVRAEVIVRATEAYTASIRGHERLIAPIANFMIATEPLPASFWEEVGWRDREAVDDAPYRFVYAQRTTDDRIAVGGGGLRYHLRARTPDPAPETDGYEIAHRRLLELFPGIEGAAITHRWAGYLGIPRDWQSSVGYRRDLGMAWAGGYVGDGVSTSNLAGRTLRDLITGEPESDLVRLPWVDHRWRRWEPEPLTWLGINAGWRVIARADRAESRTGKPSPLAAVAGKLLGVELPSGAS